MFLRLNVTPAPVVGLDFRHGHNEIRPEEQSSAAQDDRDRCIPAFVLALTNLVTIQIYEWDRPMFKFVFEASFADNHFSVTAHGPAPLRRQPGWGA
jgi:hypothetical protein